MMSSACALTSFSICVTLGLKTDSISPLWHHKQRTYQKFGVSTHEVSSVDLVRFLEFGSTFILQPSGSSIAQFPL
jgi:hypothetical protein